MNNDLVRIGTAVSVATSTVATSFFSGNPDRKNRRQLYKIQQKIFDKNLIIPANATFVLIWPVIYTGTVALAVHQALPSQRDNPRYRQARPWLLVCYALNALFGYYFSKKSRSARIGSSITTMATLPPALLLHHALEIGQTEVAQPEQTFRKAVSLYAGWLTVASVVSSANLLIENGFRPSSAASVRWASAALPATLALGVAVARRLRDPYYLVPFSVGFAGIAAKQAKREPTVAKLAAAGAVGAAAWIVRRLVR
ncbi:MAG: tryptophan-rich sensory protein [Tunicatimonas sp.]